MAAAAEGSADSEGVQAELARLTEQLNSLESWLSRAEQRRLHLFADLRAKDRAVARAAGDMEASDAELARIRADLVRLRAENGRLQARRGRQAVRIGKHLAATHRLQNQGFLRRLLDQRSAAQAQRMLVYHRYLIAARLDALESYRVATSRLERNAAALGARERAEREQRRKLEERRQQLERNRAEQRSLIESVDRDVEDRVSRRQALLQDQQRLQALLAELQRRTPTLEGIDFAGRRGSLPWPLEGEPVSRFGQPRADGRLRWHGLLLRAETGSRVRAVHRGQVVFADWLRGFGLLTIVDHGDGYLSLYGHAEALSKRPGDMVEGGEPIARAGQSGGVSTSGIYFEIRRNGNPTDPLQWLAER